MQIKYGLEYSCLTTGMYLNIGTQYEILNLDPTLSNHDVSVVTCDRGEAPWREKQRLLTYCTVRSLRYHAGFVRHLSDGWRHEAIEVGKGQDR
eukprot:scaffold7458_cov60-Attheya_sp.AAC.4